MNLKLARFLFQVVCAKNFDLSEWEGEEDVV